MPRFALAHRQSFRAALALLAIPLNVVTAPRSGRPYEFHRDDVLGTSLDLAFVATAPGDAVRAERVVLDEIERVRGLLSAYDSTSEISRLTRYGHIDQASPDLIAVLDLYDGWRTATGGAYTPRVAGLTALWKDAERRGRLPDSSDLADQSRAARGPAWRVDRETRTVTALGSGALDLNSLGKGYVIDRAVAAVRAAVPTLRGGMVNLGGDIRVWGRAPSEEGWRIGVANPQRTADNAPPLERLVLTDRAVSSSGNYARGFTIGDRHYSHIIDARTGYPADNVIGVTVVAGESATANALATTLSILPPNEGLRLANATAGVEALVITRTGVHLTTPGFSGLVSPEHAGGSAAGALAITATMVIDITPQVSNRHRPYVAAWVSDTTGKHLRTLAFWGNKPKYVPELRKWYSVTASDRRAVDGVTRATRASGSYTLEWDGLDQHGMPVAPGRYTFWFETALENGPHSVKSVNVTCSGDAQTGEITAADAFGGARITCQSSK